MAPMNDDQLLRYSRHILLEEIGVEGQERLLRSHALVIGAGGLGSPVLLYLGSGQGEEKKDEARERAREEARKRLEEEAKKPAADRKIPEFGSEKDFQLVQALNQLKGRPVLVSKTLTERTDEKKEN